MCTTYISLAKTARDDIDFHMEGWDGKKNVYIKKNNEFPKPGFSLHYKRYSKDPYLAELENQARSKKDRLMEQSSPCAAVGVEEKIDHLRHPRLKIEKKAVSTLDKHPNR